MMAAANDVCFKLNKEIKEDDLDLIIMYLENKNKSSGGDMVKHDYDPKSSTLNVTYETPNAKFGVLYKKLHKFIEYILIANLNLKTKSDLAKIDFSSKTKNFNLLILNNVRSDEDTSIVTLYAEYLVPDNEIKDVRLSKIFQNTFIIEFKDDINYEQIQKRYLKRQSLRNNVVKLYESFNTNSYFIEDPFKLEQQQLSDKAVFVYIDSLNVYLVCNTETLVDKSIECLYSLDQLRDCLINDIEVKQEPIEMTHEADKNSSTGVNNTPSIVSRVETNVLAIKTEIADIPEIKPNVPVNNVVSVIKEETLSYIEITDENPLFQALSNCKQIMSDITLNLSKINAKVVQINKKTLKIMYIVFDQSKTLEQHDIWFNQVLSIIEHFEKYINFGKIELNKPNLFKLLENNINALNQSKSDLHIYYNSPFISIIGYENSVKYSYNIITGTIKQLELQQSLQQQQQQQQQVQQKPIINYQQQQQQPTQFQIDIDPLMSTLFINCGDLFRDVQNVLASENAKLALNNANILNIIQRIPNSTELEWKDRVRELFNKFIIKNIKMHKIQIPNTTIKVFPNLMEKYKTIVNKNRIHYFLDSSSYFNIIGYYEEVNRLILQLNADLQSSDQQSLFQAPLPPQQFRQSNRTSESSNADSNNELIIRIEDDLIKSLLAGCAQIFDDLNAKLVNSNAVICVVENQNVIIKPIQKNVLNKDEWLAKVNNIVRKFKDNQLYYAELDGKLFDENLIQKFRTECYSLKNNKFVYKISSTNQVCFCGYKRSVTKIIEYLTSAKSQQPTNSSNETNQIPNFQPQPQTLPNLVGVPTSSAKPPAASNIDEPFIELDYLISLTFMNCPQIYNKLCTKLSGNNATLTFNKDKNRIEIVKKCKGSIKNEQWYNLTRKILNKFIEKSLKVVELDLNLIMNFSEVLLKQIETDLNILRQQIPNFMFYFDQNKIKLMGLVEALKQPSDYLNKFFIATPQQQQQQQGAFAKPTSNLSSRSSSTANLNEAKQAKNIFQNGALAGLAAKYNLTDRKNSESSLASNTNKQDEDPDVLTIDLNKQPKLAVLFQFNKFYLNDFTKKFENKFNDFRLIVNESKAKPSKMFIKISFKRQVAGAYFGTITDNGWKKDLYDFVAEYFDMFKLVRVNIKDGFFNVHKNPDKNGVYLKRLNSNLYEIIGLNENVDRFHEQIRIFNTNNNISSSLNNLKLDNNVAASLYGSQAYYEAPKMNHAGYRGNVQTTKPANRRSKAKKGNNKEASGTKPKLATFDEYMKRF